MYRSVLDKLKSPQSRCGEADVAVVREELREDVGFRDAPASIKGIGTAQRIEWNVVINFSLST